MAEPSTYGELYKAKAVVEADLVAAVNAFMADPTTKPMTIGAGFTVDLAAAIQASPFARMMIAEPARAEQSKKDAVRTAILLTRPVKA